MTTETFAQPSKGKNAQERPVYLDEKEMYKEIVELFAEAKYSTKNRLEQNTGHATVPKIGDGNHLSFGEFFSYMKANLLPQITLERFRTWQKHKDMAVYKEASRFFGLENVLKKLHSLPADKQDRGINLIIEEYNKLILQNGTIGKSELLPDGSVVSSPYATSGRERLETLLRAYVSPQQQLQHDTLLGLEQQNIPSTDYAKEPSRAYWSKVQKMVGNGVSVYAAGTVAGLLVPPAGLLVWLGASVPGGLLVGANTYYQDQKRTKEDVQLTLDDPSMEVEYVKKLTNLAPVFDPSLSTPDKVEVLKHWIRIHYIYTSLLKQSHELRLGPSTRSLWTDVSNRIRAYSPLYALQPNIVSSQSKPEDILRIIENGKTQLGITDDAFDHIRLDEAIFPKEKSTNKDVLTFVRDEEKRDISIALDHANRKNILRAITAGLIGTVSTSAIGISQAIQSRVVTEEVVSDVLQARNVGTGEGMSLGKNVRVDEATSAFWQNPITERIAGNVARGQMYTGREAKLYENFSQAIQEQIQSRVFGGGSQNQVARAMEKFIEHVNGTNVAGGMSAALNKLGLSRNMAYDRIREVVVFKNLSPELARQVQQQSVEWGKELASRIIQATTVATVTLSAVVGTHQGRGRSGKLPSFDSFKKYVEPEKKSTQGSSDAQSTTKPQDLRTQTPPETQTQDVTGEQGRESDTKPSDGYTSVINYWKNHEEYRRAYKHISNVSEHYRSPSTELFSSGSYKALQGIILSRLELLDKEKEIWFADFTQRFSRIQSSISSHPRKVAVTLDSLATTINLNHTLSQLRQSLNNLQIAAPIVSAVTIFKHKQDLKPHLSLEDRNLLAQIYSMTDTPTSGTQVDTLLLGVYDTYKEGPDSIFQFSTSEKADLHKYIDDLANKAEFRQRDEIRTILSTDEHTQEEREKQVRNVAALEMATLVLHSGFLTHQVKTVMLLAEVPGFDVSTTRLDQLVTLPVSEKKRLGEGVLLRLS